MLADSLVEFVNKVAHIFLPYKKKIWLHWLLIALVSIDLIMLEDSKVIKFYIPVYVFLVHSSLMDILYTRNNPVSVCHIYKYDINSYFRVAFVIVYNLLQVVTLTAIYFYGEKLLS